MPFITSVGSPHSTLKTRPLDNSQLSDSEIIKVPRGTKIAVIFPHSDQDQKIQTVRLVGNLSSLGLKTGEIYYCYYKDWLVNDQVWALSQSDFLVTKNDQESTTNSKYHPPLKPGDYWLNVLDRETDQLSLMSIYDDQGKLINSLECLAKGQKSDWSLYSGDTPVGLYKLGQLWIADSDDVTNLLPYGKYCYDMISVVDGEDAVGRSGICLHGGGSNLGYPACTYDYQQLLPTYGCIRAYNKDLATTIYKLWANAQKFGYNVWVSVEQQ